jgi:hypothetical protein
MKVNKDLEKNADDEFEEAMKSIDIEEITEIITDKRYYECFDDSFWGRENKEVVMVPIDKNIYDEYVALAKKYGCDFEEEYLICALLMFLNSKHPIDKTEEFYLRRIKEDYSSEDLEFAIEKNKQGYSYSDICFFLGDNDPIENEWNDYVKEHELDKRDKDVN